MGALEMQYDHAQRALKTQLGRLLRAAAGADTDAWGADLFRRLLTYARAVELDLDADLFRGPSPEQALGRLHLLGTELRLQQWADVWPAASEYMKLVAATEAAAGAFREAVRARRPVTVT